MAALILLAVLGLGPEPLILTDRVETIELNVVYDGEGKENFRQYIFSDWNEIESRYDVVAWRITKSEPVMSNGCLVFWDEKRLRRVRCGEYRVWHSQWDRELSQREILPQNQRRGLSKR